MAVNSLEFLLFFGVVFLLYYAVFSGTARRQNLLLLAASYAYYGLANWRMAPFLLAVTILFHRIGAKLPAIKDDRKAFRVLAIGVLVGVGTLVYCKYLDFLLGSVADLFGAGKASWSTVHVFVPLGVSFFTFRLISYVVDVYRGKLEPTTDFVAFANYVSFFPCILAGPIDRPRPVLDQLGSVRKFEYAKVSDGFRQVLWGIFKKTVIADNLAAVVDAVWAGHAKLPGGVLGLSAVLYTLQMYADFSGYSDMAIGTAKALGLRVTANFRYPFFATNVAEYWRSWHMSLTAWLTDYVFLPLNVAFRDWGKIGLCLAVVINMVVVGIWHGANWTFALFGIYHGLLFVPLVLSGAFYKKTKLESGALGLPRLGLFARMALTFALVTVGLVLFRADSVGQAFAYFEEIATFQTGSESVVASVLSKVELRIGLLFAVLTLLFEWRNRDEEYALVLREDRVSPLRRWVAYYALVLVVVLFGSAGSGFIYARF
jgi:alginate O-acetyltransferase complex protein AlgI